VFQLEKPQNSAGREESRLGPLAQKASEQLWSVTAKTLGEQGRHHMLVTLHEN
jgi:hypothetical protein